jgi:hypothetical protein
MKALTVYQPWASLIILGLKLHEFRGWPAPRFVRGQRVIIHAAARPVRYGEVAEIIESIYRSPATCGMKPGPTLDLLEDWCRRTAINRVGIFPLSACLGTVLLGEPRRCGELFAGEPDIDARMWAWPVSAPERWRVPVAGKGAQGFWDWRPAA